MGPIIVFAHRPVGLRTSLRRHRPGSEDGEGFGRFGEVDIQRGVDEFDLTGVMLAVLEGHVGQPISNVGGIDVKVTAILEQFADRRYCDAKGSLLLAQFEHSVEVRRFAERNLRQQSDRVGVGIDLVVHGVCEGIDRDLESVSPRPFPAWGRSGERVLDDVEGSERLAAPVAG